MVPLYTSTGTAVSSDAVLVELQAQSHLLGMLFWLLMILIGLFVGYLIAKVFEYMLFRHVK